MIRNILSRIARFIPGPARRHPVWASIIAVIVLLVVGGVSALTSTPPPEYVTEPAARGDLTQTVEAVGTVISERDLALQFANSGIVDRVLVKEGDKVKAGQLLAAIRAGRIAADIAAASARVASLQADLDIMRQGSRPEDIVIAEAELQNKRASLEAAESDLVTHQHEQETGLSGYVQSAGSTIERYLSSARSSLRTIDDVFNDNAVADVVIKELPADYNTMRSSMARVEGELTSAMLEATNPYSYDKALSDLQRSRDVVGDAADVVRQAYDVVASLPLSSTFTNSVRETHKATLATEKANAQAAVSALDAAIKELRDASATYATLIANDEASITTLQTTVKISEAQLALKRAGSRPEDIRSAEANVRQAQAELARASADYNDSLIKAPIDGTITQVNVKPGEYSPTGAAVTMLGTSPYRVEMFVSEIDIPKVTLTQSGSIELDAFPGVDYALRVGEVDPAATDKDGVPKYRIKLDFVYAHDEFKIGMTGDAEIITGKRTNVVSVPRRAVLENDDGEEIVRVLKDDGTVEEREVETGMEGATGNIEVTGVTEGEVIIVLQK